MIKPIIIIGAARSGTKFLRDVLGGSSHVSVIPYDVNYVWRLGNEGLEHDELKVDDLSHSRSADIRAALIAQARPTIRLSNEDSVLVEKTVSNALRVEYIRAVFPNAMFVHLLRDGREVVESAYRHWTLSPDWRYLLRKGRSFPLRNWRYAVDYIRNMAIGARTGNGHRQAIWGPRYRGIVEDVAQQPLEVVVARQWRRCVESAMQSLHALAPDRVVEVRYEDLVAEVETIKSLVGCLGISDVHNVESRYRELLAPPLVSGWETRFSDRQRDLVMTEIAEAQDELGYSESACPMIQKPAADNP